MKLYAFSLKQLTKRKGQAIRLMFELGLHQNNEDLGSSYLSPLDLEVREVVFWGCFTLDR
jgi:hypothetical protein